MTANHCHSGHALSRILYLKAKLEYKRKRIDSGRKEAYFCNNKILKPTTPTAVIDKPELSTSLA